MLSFCSCRDAKVHMVEQGTVPVLRNLEGDDRLQVKSYFKRVKSVPINTAVANLHLAQQLLAAKNVIDVNRINVCF